MDIKINRLSYKKIEIEYKVPLVTNFHQSQYSGITNKSGMNQIVKIRYTKDTEIRNRYNLIRGSVQFYIEALHFKYKIGKSIPGYYGKGYSISNITPNYTKGVNTIFEGKTISLDNFLERIDIGDSSFISTIRNKKLEEILGD